MKRRYLIVAIAIALFSACQTTTDATPRVTNEALETYRSDQATFRLVRVVDDLRDPWSFAFLPDGSILVTEISGSLWRIDGERVREVTGVPESTRNGQGGLLDLAIDPDYESNGYVYMSFADRYGSGLGTAVARGRLSGARLTDVDVIFRMQPASGGGRHFGSRLVFGTDGMLYITIGDRGARERAQELDDHAGTLVRVKPDGTVPADNPFVDNASALPEIYSYGHRNAQGITRHPQTGRIWLHEHGPQGGDEINIVRAGANYGWPVITYGVNYGTGTPIGEGTEQEGMEQPITYWSPSIAPSGMDFYTGDAFPSWSGDLFVGALAGTHLRRVELDGERVVGQEVLLQGVVGRVRDVREGPGGALYLITDESPGGLYRLEAAR